MMVHRWRKSRPRPLPSSGRRRPSAIRAWSGDWLLEDRLLMTANGPFPFPSPTVGSVDAVLYNGVTGGYEKTVTITNNSPSQWIYAFLEGQGSRQAVAPYQGTAAFDPYDPSNQEYRGYVGYTDGTTDYAGLPPLSSVTITVPLVFWDSGRIIVSTDGANQFSTYGGADGGSPVGAPFNYLDSNTQAMFFGNLDATQPDYLNFTPIYNGFDPANGGMPTTSNWRSPVASGLFRDGQVLTVRGPGLPGGAAQVTVDAADPNRLRLPSPVSTSVSAQEYVFQAATNEIIAPTARYIQPGFAFTTQGAPATTNGLVMWYHALFAQLPNNDAPYQLTEISFRGTFYDPAINTGTGFQYLLGPDVIPGAKIDSIDYDISFVDTINMPVAMSASNVAIPNVNVTQPFGWVGSGQSLDGFQRAVAAFTSTNPAGGANVNDLGTYFDGRGYPSYLPVDPGNVKLPAGQNLFLASPAIGGAADIQFYKTFSDNSFIRQPLYALTSGGTGPITLSLGGDPIHPSSGPNLGLNTVSMANQFALNQLIASNVAAGERYVATYVLNGTTMTAGNVIGMYYDQDGTTIIGVKLDQDVPADASTQVYNFTLPKTDYAASRIAGLWYSWAKYYADQVASTPQSNLPGTITPAGNILVLASPATGLVAGMGVTGAGVPAGCLVLSVSSDRKTIELSAAVSGNPTSFSFAAPSFATVAGFDPNPQGNTPLIGLAFTPAQEAYALSFARTVYLVMSAWSVSIPSGTPNGWNPLLVNIIGGNLGPNYLPDANTDVVNALTDLSKSVLRGVPDFTNPQYANPALWYPDPSLPAGGQTYNVYNLDPFVWFIHKKLGLTAYAFSLDDDVGNVNAGGATHLDVSVGGLGGLVNKDPYTNVSPWGVVSSASSNAQALSSVIAGLANPKVVYQINQFDYNHDTPGTLVNGPGVTMGTTVQFSQIAQDLAQSRIVLSNPLTASSGASSYAFFGPMNFTGTVLGTAQAGDTILLDSLDAYNTLLKLGPLTSVQVTGQGIDPASTVTVKTLTRDATSGVITLKLSSGLDPALVSQPGGFYAYTFGSAVVGVVRDPGFEWADVSALAGGFNHGMQLSQNTVDWTFTDSPTQPNALFAGIAFSNSSTYTSGNPLPPQGLQVGFVQGDSRLSQVVTIGGGSYSLSVSAAQSAAFPGAQTLNVLLDDVVVGTIAPQTTAYASSVIPLTVSSGRHTISFVGTSATTGAVLLDAFALAPVVAANPFPSAPLLNAIPAQAVNEGSVVAFTAVAASLASPVTYSLDPGAPAGATIDPRTGVFTWSRAVPGLYTVTVRATDANSPPLSSVQIVSIAVNNVAPSVIVAPVAASQTADFRDSGLFADLTPGAFVGTVDYGDGTGPQPLPLTPLRTYSLAHTYTRPGTYRVIVAVKDSLGGVGSASLMITATAAPLASGSGLGRDAFVTSLFQGNLGRLPDPDGLKFWSGRLAKSGDSRSVARSIWGSAEHRELVANGRVTPITFRRWYANALRSRRRAIRLQLPPPAGPLALQVAESPTG